MVIKAILFRTFTSNNFIIVLLVCMQHRHMDTNQIYKYTNNTENIKSSDETTKKGSISIIVVIFMAEIWSIKKTYHRSRAWFSLREITLESRYS